VTTHSRCAPGLFLQRGTPGGVRRAEENSGGTMVSKIDEGKRVGTRWISWICLSVLVLTTSACDTSTDTEAASPAAQVSQPRPEQQHSTRLESLISKFVEARRARNDRTKLPDVSADAFLADIAADRQLLEEISAVDPQNLSVPEKIDLRMMIGILESEIFSAERRRLWENDPSLYVPAYQIGRLISPMAAETAAHRSVALVSLLEKIPDRLAEARRNLKNPSRRYTETAVFKTRGTVESLRNDGPALLEKAGTDAGTFQAALAKAIDALEEYERFLSGDLLERATGDWAIGKEHYDYILQHRWFMDADADQILARGRQAFKDTEVLAQEVSERIDPGKHWSEVYDGLQDDHPPADGIKAAYQKEIDAARAFVKEHGIVTLPEGERVITVDTPPAMRRSSPFGTFQSVDQFGDGLEGRLVLTPIEDWMSAEQRAARLRSHHYAWIPIIAVHEAYPGHHVDALKRRENPRILRKVVQEPIFSEGWGLFTEEMMYEQGFLKGDEVRLTQLRNRLWRAARVILDVSLHTGRMSFDEAVDFLSEKVRFERYAAELDVGMYVERPTYVLGYLIGMQEIMKIQDEYEERYGPPSPPSEFYDQLLSVGALPPVLVRQALFGEDDSADAAAR
jgi:uncharacterized protein (DUF885 family)